MTIEEKGKYYREKGYNCCQSVLCTLKEYTGLSEELSAALASGFGGGMQCGNVCGAVTGSLMAIGSTCLPGKDPEAEKPLGVELTKALEAEFEEKAGTLLCGDITEKYDRDRCDEFILFAATVAERIIQEQLKKNEENKENEA